MGGPEGSDRIHGEAGREVPVAPVRVPGQRRAGHDVVARAEPGTRHSLRGGRRRPAPRGPHADGAGAHERPGPDGGPRFDHQPGGRDVDVIGEHGGRDDRRGRPDPLRVAAFVAALALGATVALGAVGPASPWPAADRPSPTAGPVTGPRRGAAPVVDPALGQAALGQLAVVRGTRARAWVAVRSGAGAARANLGLPAGDYVASIVCVGAGTVLVRIGTAGTNPRLVEVSCGAAPAATGLSTDGGPVTLTATPTGATAAALAWRITRA